MGLLSALEHATKRFEFNVQVTDHCDQVFKKSFEVTFEVRGSQQE